MGNHKRVVTQVTLVAASAAIVPFCFPPYGYWPLMLPSLSILLWVTTDTTARRAFYLGMLHGMLGYGFTMYWLGHIFGSAAISLFAILALFTAGFCLSYNHLSDRLASPHLKVLLAAVLWTGIEFYRSELFFLRFPWITPGTAVGPTFLSPVVGVYGTSFVVITSAAGFLHRRTVPPAIVLSSGVLLLGMIRPGPIEPADDAIRVALVQCEGCDLETLLEMTRSTAEDRPDLVVWPEYSLPYDVRKHADDLALLVDLCAEMNVVLVVGTKTVTGPGEREWYNTALTIGGNGVMGEYYKARPVHFFNDGIAGRSCHPVDSDLGAFGTPICFDCDYTAVARRMALNGAEFFAVPSLDPAPWSADQHRQHAVLFRIRAAENARWLACAASSGVSQIVDPHGNVHAGLPPLTTGILTDRIDSNRRLTFFARAGWLFPWFTLGGTAALLTYAGLRLAVRNRTVALQKSNS